MLVSIQQWILSTMTIGFLNGRLSYTNEVWFHFVTQGPHLLGGIHNPPMKFIRGFFYFVYTFLFQFFFLQCGQVKRLVLNICIAFVYSLNVGLKVSLQFLHS